MDIHGKMPMKLYVCRYIDTESDMIKYLGKRVVCESTDMLEIEQAVYDNEDEVIGAADMHFKLVLGNEDNGYWLEDTFYSHRDFLKIFTEINY